MYAVYAKTKLKTRVQFATDASPLLTSYWGQAPKLSFSVKMRRFSQKHLDGNYNLVTFAPIFQLQMGAKEKLRERFLKMPSDFTFDEMQRLLEGYGYEKSNKGKTSGSRLIFKNGDKRPIMLHKPHPGNIVKGYAMKQVLEDLKEAGLIK